MSFYSRSSPGQTMSLALPHSIIVSLGLWGLAIAICPAQDSPSPIAPGTPPADATAPFGSNDSIGTSPQSDQVIHAQRGTVMLDQEAMIATDQPGTLGQITAVEGQQVEAGQVVARLRSEVAEAALRVASKSADSDIEIRFARAASAVAAKELDRSLRANEVTPGTIPELEIDQLRLAAHRSELQIDKAILDHEVAMLQRDQKQAELDRHVITSPISGIVTEVFKNPGEAVQQGDPILHIVRTDVVRVEGYISVAQVSEVRPGDEVLVRIDLPNLPPELAEMTFRGKLVFMDPTVETVSAGVRVWARVDNPDNLLRAGLPATISIQPSTSSTSEAMRSGSNPKESLR